MNISVDRPRSADDLPDGKILRDRCDSPLHQINVIDRVEGLVIAMQNNRFLKNEVADKFAVPIKGDHGSWIHAIYETGVKIVTYVNVSPEDYVTGYILITC